jgi:hypothetical protein
MNQNEIKGIIEAYDKLVRNIDTEAKNSDTRAYGGIVREGKGMLVESIAKTLVEIAWEELTGKNNRLKFSDKKNRTTIKIPINENYINKLKDLEIKKYIMDNIEKYTYRYKPDVLVFIDDKPVLEIECKAFTENAMFKRILVDSSLIKTIYPDIKFILLQLESQLGGDYGEIKEKYVGSPSTTTLMSYFNVEIEIITLLKGERKVDEPIHKEEYFKELTEESLKIAINKIKKQLKEFI